MWFLDLGAINTSISSMDCKFKSRFLCFCSCRVRSPSVDESKFPSFEGFHLQPRARQPPEFVISINWSRTSLMQRWEGCLIFWSCTSWARQIWKKHLLVGTPNGGNGWYMDGTWRVHRVFLSDSEWFSGIIFGRLRLDQFQISKRTGRDSHFSSLFGCARDCCTTCSDVSTPRK